MIEKAIVSLPHSFWKPQAHKNFLVGWNKRLEMKEKEVSGIVQRVVEGYWKVLVFCELFFEASSKKKKNVLISVLWIFLWLVARKEENLKEVNTVRLPSEEITKGVVWSFGHF